MTDRYQRPRGVGGDRFASDPIGAVLRVGHKGPRGNPIDKDRFSFAVPQEVENVRDFHPSFFRYHKLEAQYRRLIFGNLMHPHLEDAVHIQRYAFRLPKPPFEPPPNKRPACEGDGERATRYVDGDFRGIPCPADRCEFAQAGICKVLVQVLFRPRWKTEDQYPSLLTKYSSRGEHMLSSLYGMLDHVATIAHGVGMLGGDPPAETRGYERMIEAGFDVLGLPFSMTLVEKTSKEKRTRFPRVIFGFDGDVVEWLEGKMRRQQSLQAANVSLAALPPAEVAADVQELEP